MGVWSGRFLVGRSVGALAGAGPGVGGALWVPLPLVLRSVGFVLSWGPVRRWRRAAALGGRGPRRSSPSRSGWRSRLCGCARGRCSSGWLAPGASCARPGSCSARAPGGSPLLLAVRSRSPWSSWSPADPALVVRPGLVPGPWGCCRVVCPVSLVVASPSSSRGCLVGVPRWLSLLAAAASRSLGCGGGARLLVRLSPSRWLVRGALGRPPGVLGPRPVLRRGLGGLRAGWRPVLSAGVRRWPGALGGRARGAWVRAARRVVRAAGVPMTAPRFPARRWGRCVPPIWGRRPFRFRSVSSRCRARAWGLSPRRERG